MSLNKSMLEAAIKNAFKNMKNTDGDEEQTLNALSGKLAEAIDTYIKTAQINYIPPGLQDSVGGPVTGVFNGFLS
ncbi:MAG: hypothetical protein H6Q26_110 [Bacteroidetes bacterium]|uniref:hypothetical protein n=1 Tax=unclassified Chitinophaga TaxID=2619133 RepID=UPI0009C5A520|nr:MULTISPECIES: hypothetical protein [unclassified Chitinophaga]MBP1649953.1 hypothetical protein [Bacteroidota bacterium]OMP79688.1 hypothetical protein BW716_08175 [[Flexibacter] sp. ATCC 35208]WPV66583.1 hypothetical protein QQL36_32840 [Chitinophaga sp. LS1]